MKNISEKRILQSFESTIIKLLLSGNPNLLFKYFTNR